MKKTINFVHLRIAGGLQGKKFENTEKNYINTQINKFFQVIIKIN
jgi:hypothetical protein